MKRLIIVCEGPTEHEFCINTLFPFFYRNGIIIEAPLVKKSNGGIVPWPSIKRQIEMHLHESDVRVSLLVDYYGIKDSYEFPGWEEAKDIDSKEAKWKFLCDRMKADIAQELAPRFIPYMQIHEFESLLFSDISVFKNNFDNHELDFSILEDAIREFHDPEDINSRPDLAPSKRLLQAIPGYEKIIYGDCLASEIGLDKIRKMCPLFNQWVLQLLAI